MVTEIKASISSTPAYPDSDGQLMADNTKQFRWIVAIKEILELLKAFDHLTLYFLPDLTRFMTPLSDLQKRILELMKLPESLYHLHLKQGKT